MELNATILTLIVPLSTQNHKFLDVVQGSHLREYSPALGPYDIFARGKKS